MSSLLDEWLTITNDKWSAASHFSPSNWIFRRNFDLLFNCFLWNKSKTNTFFSVQINFTAEHLILTPIYSDCTLGITTATKWKQKNVTSIAHNHFDDLFFAVRLCGWARKMKSNIRMTTFPNQKIKLINWTMKLAKRETTFFLSRQIERCVDRSTCNWFFVSLNQLVIFIQQSHMNVLFMFHRSRSR